PAAHQRPDRDRRPAPARLAQRLRRRRAGRAGAHAVLRLSRAAPEAGADALHRSRNAERAGQGGVRGAAGLCQSRAQPGTHDVRSAAGCNPARSAGSESLTRKREPMNTIAARHFVPMTWVTAFAGTTPRMLLRGIAR